MRAVGIEAFGGADRLQMMDLPIPEPGPREVRIRVHAAGVNPIDWKIRIGRVKDRWPHQFPVVLGFDAAGVVDAVGPGVKRFKGGEAVYGYFRKPVVHGGTYAEYVVVPESFPALKPQRLSFEEAAAVPLAALTAWQGLFDVCGLKEGEVALIHAAAGGVGSFAVQFAAHKGARVIGTASGRNHDYLRELGAHETIDYMRENVVEAALRHHPHGIHVVYDGVGAGTATQSVPMLHKNGRVLTIVDAAEAETLRRQGINAHHFFATPNAGQLGSMATMIDAGKLRVEIDAVFSIEQARKAHERLETGHTRGKIVLRVD